ADHKYRRLLLSFTVFGIGNLMNVAVYPILLVDHFNASNAFVGAMMAVSSATMTVAYFVWGRMIDRGSSIRLTLLITVVTLLSLGMRHHGRAGPSHRADSRAERARGRREPRRLSPEGDPARAHGAHEAVRDQPVPLVGRMEAVRRHRPR